MKKLPPYGKSITSSPDPVWIFAGYYSQAINFLKHRYTNTMGIFLWEDPQNYYWPVEGREVIVFCWLCPDDEYLKRLAVTLYRAGAKSIYIFNVNTQDQIDY